MRLTKLDRGELQASALDRLAKGDYKPTQYLTQKSCTLSLLVPRIE